MPKEAKARILINDLLRRSGWRFFDDETGTANIALEANVKLKKKVLDDLGEDFEKTDNGFVDYLLLDEREFPIAVLEAKSEEFDPLVGLPAGVFNPYSGVKTSILFLDRNLAKRTDEVLFVKVENDGFDLGAQRRPIEGSDLTGALKIMDSHKKGSTFAMASADRQQTEENKMAHAVSRKRLLESVDCNLSGDRYRPVALRPSGKWPMVKLGEVCEILNGYAFKSENYVASGIRIIRITNVQSGFIVDDSPKFYPLDTKDSIADVMLSSDDLLLSLTGNVGRVGLLPSDMLPAALNQRVACLRSLDEQRLNSRFLFCLLNDPSFESECISSASGVAQKNLSTVWLSRYEIPLPPLEEQERIVAELEGFRKVIEGARQVLANYKPTIRIHPAWPMASLGDIAVEIKSGFACGTSDGNESGIPHLRPMNISTDGRLVWEGTKYISERVFSDKSDYLLRAGDILFNNTNSKELVGKTCFVDQDIRAGFSNHMTRIRLDTTKMMPRLLAVLLHQLWRRGRFLDLCHKWVGQAGINNTILSTIEILLPPIDIQRRIAAELEAERKLVEANRELIARMETKIQAKLAEVWGEG